MEELDMTRENPDNMLKSLDQSSHKTRLITTTESKLLIAEYHATTIIVYNNDDID